MGKSQSRLSIKSADDQQRQQFQLSHFPQFYLLSDEIVLEILSFVTQAPFEFDEEDIDASASASTIASTMGTSESASAKAKAKAKVSPSKHSHRLLSSLTHTLPFVSKHFYKLCKYDKLWIQSLRNLVKNNPNQWKYAFTSLLLYYDGRIPNPTWSSFHDQPTDGNNFLLASKVKNMDTMDKDEFDKFIMDVYKSVVNHENAGTITCNNKYSFMTMNRCLNSNNDGANNFGSGLNRAKEFYLTMVVNYIQITMPIFQMRHPSLRKGTYMDLMFFEPRYQKLISDIMKGRKTADYRGRTLKDPRPKFIFANGENVNNNNNNNNNGGEGLTVESASYGYIVEVCKCQMLLGAPTQIRIHVLKKIKILRRKERAHLNIGLYDAHIKRFH